MFENVEFLLENRTWSQSCLRLNMAKPEDVHTGRTGFKRANILSGLVHNHNTQDKLLRTALSKISPEWWGLDTVTTNKKNVECQPQRRLQLHLLLGRLRGRGVVIRGRERHPRKV